MTTTFANPDLAHKVETALRTEFPNAAIELRPNYQGLIHAIIVSPSFNRMTEREKQERVWNTLHSALGDAADDVTLAVAYSIDEIYN